MTNNAEIVKICCDRNCPSCDYPETLIATDLATMEPISVECSKRCGWTKDLRTNK